MIGICGCEPTWQLGDFADADDRTDSRAGRRRARDLRTHRRCRFVASSRRCCTKRSGHSCPASWSTTACCARTNKQMVIRRVHRPLQNRLARRRCGRPIPGRAWRGSPNRKRNAAASATRSSSASRRKPTKIEDAHFLAQGTLYPDVIESGAAPDGPAATIKLHHNVGGLPEELGFELIEPLRDLFKDEVRRLGLELGLPERSVWRHPFPGPGWPFAVWAKSPARNWRCCAKPTRSSSTKSRRPACIAKPAKSFAVLLPVQSVGVMGDARTYDNAIAIRCVNTDDFMTADWSRLPYDLLARMIRESSTKSKASIASATTSAPNHPPRSNGNNKEFDGSARAVTSSVHFTQRRTTLTQRTHGTQYIYQVEV